MLNSTHKSIASEPVVLYNADGIRLTDEIIYDNSGNLTTSPLMAVVSSRTDELSELAMDGQTDNRKVDFIVSESDLPERPQDGYWIVYNDIKYNCYQRDGQVNSGKYSDQFNGRYRIQTRRQGD